MRPRVREFFNEGGNHPESLLKENVKLKSFIDNSTLNKKYNGIKLIEPKILVEANDFYQSYNQIKV